MAKKILIVEDDVLVYQMLEDALRPSFDIVRARAVDEACGAVEKKGPFDCFVVDLNILASGLSVADMAKYKRREGYAFLKNHLWKGTEDEIKELKRKTIICSRYATDFKKEFKGEIEDLQIVLKNTGFEKKVLELIEKI